MWCILYCKYAASAMLFILPTATRSIWHSHISAYWYQRIQIPLEILLPNYGKGYSFYRMRTPSHYKRKDSKINSTMLIDPGNPGSPDGKDSSILRPRIWLHISQVICSQCVLSDFINSILKYIESHPVPGNINDSSCLFWNNFRSHKTTYSKKNNRRTPLK